MKTYIIKFKHIIPTFLTVAFGTVFGLALIRWLFCLQFTIIDIKEEIWESWIPIIFPWIPITLWLRQRFRILTFKDNDKGRFGFQMMSWIIICAMSIFSQAYLTTATGKIQDISTIREIEKTEKSRYYKITNFAVDPYYGGSYTDFRQSGKHNERLNFGVYFVAPILKDTSERIIETPKYWYGVGFNEGVSNRISEEEKKEKYEAFYKECVEKMNKYEFYSLDHFERKPTSDSRKNYLKAIEARIKQPTDDSFTILVPIQEKYEDRNGNKLAWIFGSFGIGFIVLLFALIWPKHNESQRKKFLAGKKPKQDDLIDMLNYLIPKEDHFVTSIILDLNILVFLVMVFLGVDIMSPKGIELLQWGANRRLETIGGDWWRLFTSMFLHGGFMHLILNISGLVIAAIFIEPLFGRKSYFILYILSGLCASLASIWWYPHMISVGASGAIFGLYGAILGLLLTNAFPKEIKRYVFIMTGIYVVINLLLGLTGGIDNAAHIGGLISGALFGILLYKIDGKKNEI